MAPAMAERLICDLCGKPIAPHAHYIVRIDVLADPSMPPMSSEELEETDPDQTLNQLLEQMKDMSADELQNQVHRRFEFVLCRPCQMRYLANPLGLPRQRQPGRN
jgi:hypothetical protein